MLWSTLDLAVVRFRPKSEKNPRWEELELELEAEVELVEVMLEGGKLCELLTEFPVIVVLVVLVVLDAVVVEETSLC